MLLSPKDVCQEAMLVRTATPVVFLTTATATQTIEVSGINSLPGLKGTVCHFPNRKGTSQTSGKCSSFGGERYFCKHAVLASKPEIVRFAKPEKFCTLSPRLLALPAIGRGPARGSSCKHPARVWAYKSLFSKRVEAGGGERSRNRAISLD